MAIEYRLTLAGKTPVIEVAERAFPNPEERPTGTPPLLSAALWDRYGFQLTIRAAKNGYVDVETDNGPWEWKTADYVALTFRMDKFADPTAPALNMLAAVRRVLESGSEDAVLTLNGDILLLTRIAGPATKHHPTWWTTHPGATTELPT